MKAEHEKSPPPVWVIDEEKAQVLRRELGNTFRFVGTSSGEESLGRPEIGEIEVYEDPNKNVVFITETPEGKFVVAASRPAKPFVADAIGEEPAKLP